MDEQHHKVLRRLAQELDAPTLTGKNYERCNQIFRSLTNQQDIMLDWVMQQLHTGQVTNASGSKPLSILSVGSGCGLFEIALIKRLREEEPSRSLHFTGIDPNTEECQTIDKALAKIPRLASNIHNCKFEDYTASRGFDLILFVHSLYYLKSPEGPLSKAKNLLNPHASMMLFSAEQGGLNLAAQAFRATTDKHAFVFQDHIDNWLANQTLAVKSQRLNAMLDLNNLDQRLSSQPYLDFLSFLTQRDLKECLTENSLHSLDIWLNSEETSSNGQLSHPVWAYQISHIKSKSTAYRPTLTTADAF